MLRVNYECLGIAANMTTVIDMTADSIFLLVIVLPTLIEKG